MRKSEYVVDRLQEEIKLLEDRVEKLISENEVLNSECKFGAAVSFTFGLTLGLLAATVIAWRG